MSRSKRILLLSILVFPGLLYFLFELSEVNFKKMAFYGPKRYDQSIKDTVYYAAPLNAFQTIDKLPAQLDTNKYPVFLIGFLHEEFRQDGYKLQGLLDYTQYKPEKLKYMNIFLVSPFDSVPASRKPELKIKNSEVEELFVNRSSFDSLNSLFFKEKPLHVFPYFFALVDKNRNIRGYYDPTYVSEVKRMLQEFEHLKLRDEKAKLLKETKLEKKES